MITILKGIKLNRFELLSPLEVLLFFAIALAVTLRILNLSSHEFWYDEVLSLLLFSGQKTAYETPGEVPVLLSSYTSLLKLPVETGLGDIVETLKQILRGIAGGEPHPPLFFLSQHLWLRLFGNAVAQVRSLGVLLSCLAIFSAYGLGRDVLGHRGGLIFAALLATNSFYLFHSLNVRMYGPLVLWIVLSGWALVRLIRQNTVEANVTRRQQLLWNCLLIGSVTAGLLTFYFFAYWVIALGVLVLYLDRQRWFQYGIALGIAVSLTIPWAFWGVRQQARNADLDRFAESIGFIEALFKHFRDALEAVGIQLLSGGLSTSISHEVAVLIGFIVVAILLTCCIWLWRQGEYQTLGTALILGVLPLALALSVDVFTGKFTLGWGYGRSIIFVLPGCLLLIAAGLERAMDHWQKPLIAALLATYVCVGVGDFNLRDRHMFHTVNQLIQQNIETPTLIVMSSKAWGHVLRLAYYVTPDAPVSLLAEKPEQLAATLDKTLTDTALAYERILWLNPERAVWSEPKTDAEKQQFDQAVQQVLQAQYKLTSTEALSGTMDLDRFTLSLYTQSPAT
ncbi:glycosyltransferase family 39 protein [Oculatella sp. FACHB-28]|uniref:glycosyltransferase family 39 protein n=1 Tax=Oculatella sp. FACHB-28 TaxID=2692845 RepID=UPI00168448BB|nr:glycosyltransferase family 39 protein [Oculatella sp. FACHB-28]MBD2060434.1 glycosyltransferase family 39 protein [Oculatella sp. FACHB-28]